MADRPRVLVSLLDEDLEYQRMQAAEARSAAARLGIDAEVAYCKVDPAVQLRQLSEAVRAPAGKRPAALILQPAAVAGLEEVARAALEAGIGWVSMDPAVYIERVQRAFPEGLAALAVVDNREMGRLQARVFRALLPHGGRVLCLEGPSVSPSTLRRREGMQEGLRGSGVVVFKTLTGDWSEASGERAATFWLRLSELGVRPDLVGSQNDLMAAGARKAFQALKPEWLDVPFTGCDGVPEGGQRLVKEKVLAATVVQPTTTGLALELVARWRRGEKVSPVTFLPPRTVPAIEELERGGRG
jgi:ribose transport system substrate-binding protein